MTEIIGVRFKDGGKEYYFDPCGATVHTGDEVIIETANGIEFGVCSRANSQVEDESVTKPLRPLLRLATARDRETLAMNRLREQEAMSVCAEKIALHGLDMKLVRCECSFDGNKMLFFFTSEGRVDFRALVKDLASTFHARIELRQIGVRDESRLLGGLGICGRPFCCNAFLDQFQPVSIKMAKTQGLSLNPAKISGSCGRLMCCLKYEQGAYEDAVRRLPRTDSFVETPDGVGTITGVDYLREKVKVRLENQTDVLPQSYSPDELNVIRSGKGRRPEGYVAPSPAELGKLRKSTPPPSVPLDPKKAINQSIDEALSDLRGDTSPRKQRKASPVKGEPATGKGGPSKRSRQGRGDGALAGAESFPKSQSIPAATDDDGWPSLPKEDKQAHGRHRKHRGGKPGGRN